MKVQTESSAVWIATKDFKAPRIKETRTTGSFARRPYCRIAVLVIFYYPICLTFVFLLVFAAISLSVVGVGMQVIVTTEGQILLMVWRKKYLNPKGVVVSLDF